MPFISQIEFFKERGIEGAALFDVVSCMEFMTINKDNFVFEFGDQGDLFYLLLEGKVEVQIPDNT